MLDGPFCFSVRAADVDGEYVGLAIRSVAVELLLQLGQDVVGRGVCAAGVGVDDAAGVAFCVGDGDARLTRGGGVVCGRSVGFRFDFEGDYYVADGDAVVAVFASGGVVMLEGDRADLEALDVPGDLALDGRAPSPDVVVRRLSVPTGVKGALEREKTAATRGRAKVSRSYAKGSAQRASSSAARSLAGVSA